MSLVEVELMSEKSPTERLRAMLDERGIEYIADENGVSWNSAYHPNGFAYDVAWYLDTTAKPHTVGALSETTIYGLTPEQAIAATVGEQPEMHICKRCGVAYELNIIDKGFGKPRFCPNCGYRRLYQ